jgi:hypothetical protein
MSDDDRFPRKTGPGWGPAVDSIREPVPDAPRADDTASTPLLRAVEQTIRAIPAGTLDFENLAGEVQRIAKLVEDPDVSDFGLCGLCADDESVRLLAQLALLVVATMGSDRRDRPAPLIQRVRFHAFPCVSIR